MVKNTAIQKMMDGAKVRATKWEQGKYIYLNDSMQIVDNEGKPFNIKNCKEKSWELYKEPEISCDNKELVGMIKKLLDEVNELKKAINNKDNVDVDVDVDVGYIAESVADEVVSAVKSSLKDEIKEAVREEDPTNEFSSAEAIKIFYGVDSPGQVKEMFKDELLKCNDKRDVAKTVSKFIPFCWMGGRKIKTVARYYADMRNIIKEVNDEYMEYALELFAVPKEAYERIKQIDTKKVLEKLESKETFDEKEIEMTMEQVKKWILKAMELGDDVSIEEWKAAGLPMQKQQTVERARAYLYAIYLAYATGRRITEILKTLEIVKKEDGWYYKGIAKKGGNDSEIKAVALDDDFELLSKLLQQIRKDIDTKNMTNAQVNSKFNHIFNRALKNITGLKYTFHDLREIFAEMAYLKFGKKNGSDREKEDYISDILGHEINKDRLVSANHYMTKEAEK